MEFLVGLMLALGVSLGGTVAGLDRERAFYTAVALAVGTYYILFAVMGGSSEALIREVLAFAVLAAVAVVGLPSAQMRPTPVIGPSQSATARLAK
jgi:hypothetical protein